MTDYVFLDPGGTQQFGLFVVVQRPTGVTYGHQCAGHATEVRSVEGFLVPLGGPDAAGSLIEFFARTCKGNPPLPDGPWWDTYWTEAAVAELRELVGQIPCWVTAENGDDVRLVLELDESRLREVTEGWLPVNTPIGKAILLFENCD